jgi:hypothetical protein
MLPIMQSTLYFLNDSAIFYVKIESSVSSLKDMTYVFGEINFNYPNTFGTFFKWIVRPSGLSD